MNGFTKRERIRTLLLAAAAVITAVCLSDGVELATGTLTDSRNGRTYGTMKAGAKTWMTDNINIETGNSWCYDNDTSSCYAYGRLYDWETAKTVCPQGWRLPTIKEWGVFLKAVNDKDAAYKRARAKESNDDDADNYPNLPLILGGGHYRIGGEYANIGGYSYWWAAAEKSNQYAAYYRYVNYGNENIADNFDLREYGFSVRCLKD